MLFYFFLNNLSLEHIRKISRYKYIYCITGNKHPEPSKDITMVNKGNRKLKLTPIFNIFLYASKIKLIRIYRQQAILLDLW